MNIWCENSLKVLSDQQENLNFYLAQKIKVDVECAVVPQACWINIHKYYNNFTKPPEYIFGDSKFGSYTLLSSNLMILAILIVVAADCSRTRVSRSTPSTTSSTSVDRSSPTKPTPTPTAM